VRLYPGLGWKDTAAHDKNRTDGRNKSLFTRLNHIRGLRFYREWLVKTKVEAIHKQKRLCIIHILIWIIRDNTIILGIN